MVICISTVWNLFTKSDVAGKLLFWLGAESANTTRNLNRRTNVKL